MPTATRVLLINGVNSGISYPIINDDTVDDTTQPQGGQMSTEQQLDDDSNDKRSIASSIDDGPSTKRHKSSEDDQIDDTPTCFSVAHPRDSQYLSPRQCYFRTNCIEYFIASEDFKAKGPTGTVKKGRVGVRCIFCKDLPLSERVPQHSSFPNKISSIYSCHTMIELRHIKECKHVPKKVLDELEKANKTKRSNKTGTTNQYTEDSARDKGLFDKSSAYTRGVFWSKERMGNVVFPSSYLSSMEKEKSSKKRVKGSKPTNPKPKKEKKTAIEKVYPVPAEGYKILDPSMSLVTPDMERRATPYLCFIFQQLRGCNLNKGGPSKNNIYKSMPDGFPGLECVHCKERRFFYRDTETYKANYAHIPEHILKCSHCPAIIKEELATKKTQHLILQKKPRGSQSQFFDSLCTRLGQK